MSLACEQTEELHLFTEHDHENIRSVLETLFNTDCNCDLDIEHLFYDTRHYNRNSFFYDSEVFTASLGYEPDDAVGASRVTIEVSGECINVSLDAIYLHSDYRGLGYSRTFTQALAQAAAEKIEPHIARTLTMAGNTHVTVSAEVFDHRAQSCVLKFFDALKLMERGRIRVEQNINHYW